MRFLIQVPQVRSNEETSFNNNSKICGPTHNQHNEARNGEKSETSTVNPKAKDQRHQFIDGVSDLVGRK
jgi:hypothetical protein